MAKTRKEKEEIVARLVDMFREAKSTAFSSISGYTMAQADDLRSKAKEQNVEVLIAKKTLLATATKEAGIEDIDPRSFEGSILTAVSFGDEVSAAKLLKDFQKTNEEFSLVSINAPVSGFVNVLAGNLRGLVTVLGAIKDQKGA